jgi:hypothetical protein
MNPIYGNWEYTYSKRGENMENSNPLVNGETFRLRLTHDMKEWLFETAAQRHTTVSDIMRSLVRAEMNKGKKRR